MTTALRRWGPWAVLVAVAVAVLAVGLHRSGHPSLDARAQSLAAQVRCPVCNGETVAQSQAAPSVEIRNQIRKDLQAGETDNQILAGLVQSYGAGILEKPQASGIGLLVWVIPVVAVVVAGGVLSLVLLRWRRRGATELATGGLDAGGADAGGTAVAPSQQTPAAAGPSASGAAPVAAPTGGGVATAVIDEPGAVPPAPGVPPGPGGPPGAGAAAPGSSGPRRADRRRWSTRTRWAATGGVLAVVAAGASWAVAASSGTRLPGESITGQVLPDQQVAADLQNAAAAAQRNDVVGALKDYEKVLKVEPKQVDALTAMGWLLAQTGQPSLLKQGLSELAAAERAQPSYAPAHLYRGVSLLGEGDYADSVPELQWYLDHNPDPQLVPQVKKALAQAQAGLAATRAAGAPGSSGGSSPSGASPAPAGG